jgi:hypothetical protein
MVRIKIFLEQDGDVTDDFFYPAGKTGRMPVACTRIQDQENSRDWFSV